jgi:TonB family protein
MTPTPSSRLNKLDATEIVSWLSGSKQGVLEVRNLSTLAICAITLALIGSASLAAVVENPDWMRKPSPDEVSYAYPVFAAWIELSGEAAVVCQVTVEGSLENCHVTSESPAGMGFGAAALALAKDFEMKPMMVDGKPIEGSEVQIPIHFEYPPDEVTPDATTLTPPGDPATKAAALRLAQLVDTAGGFDQSQLRLEDALRIKAQTLSPDRQAAAMDAVHTAIAQARGAYEDALADVLASGMTPSALQQTAAFFASPAGQEWLTRQATLQPKLRVVGSDYNEQIERFAHEAFCAKTDCSIAKRQDRRPTVSVGDSPPAP